MFRCAYLFLNCTRAYTQHSHLSNIWINGIRIPMHYSLLADSTTDNTNSNNCFLFCFVELFQTASKDMRVNGTHSVNAQHNFPFQCELLLPLPHQNQTGPSDPKIPKAPPHVQNNQPIAQQVDYIHYFDSHSLAYIHFINNINNIIQNINSSITLHALCIFTIQYINHAYSQYNTLTMHIHNIIHKPCIFTIQYINHAYSQYNTQTMHIHNIIHKPFIFTI